MTDERVLNTAMLEYVKGDEQAFKTLYEGLSPHVWAYLRRRISDQARAADIFQEVFLKFHNSRHLYKSEHSPLKWIYVITRSTLIDYYKKNKVLPVEELKMAHQNSTESVSPEINLDELSPDQRLAVELRHQEGAEFFEIAKIMNKSEATVRKILSRAYQKLRTR